jgi:hypothetical protein
MSMMPSPAEHGQVVVRHAHPSRRIVESVRKFCGDRSEREAGSMDTFGRAFRPWHCFNLIIIINFALYLFTIA